MQVDRTRALPALANGPYDQRLASPHVTAGENAILTGCIAAGISLDIAAWIERAAGLLDHSAPARTGEAHGEQHEIGLDLKFTAYDLARLAVNPFDPRTFERMEYAADTDEALGHHGPVALAPFLLRGRGAQLHR